MKIDFLKPRNRRLGRVYCQKEKMEAMGMQNSERSAEIYINVRPWVRERLLDIAEKMTLPENNSKQMSLSRLASDLLEYALVMRMEEKVHDESIRA